MPGLEEAPAANRRRLRPAVPLSRRPPLGAATVRHGTPDALAPAGRLPALGLRGAARPVLCAVDGSAASRRAAHQAAALAEALGARLMLAVADAGLSTFRFHRARVRGNAEAAVARLRAELGPECETRACVEVGAPTKHLVDIAFEERAELLVVGVPPGALPGMALLGRRLRDLVRHSPCPVVAVPPQAEAEPATRCHPGGETLVCGVDASEASRVAAKVAAGLASRLGLRPIAVHAYEPPSNMSLEPIVAPPGSEPGDVDERQAWALLGLAVKELDGRGHVRTIEEREDTAAEGRFVLGPPAQTLRRIAAREHSQLIVVGSTGARMLRSMLLGSVPAQLASAATTPIVIVPRTARRWPGGRMGDPRKSSSSPQ